MRARSTVLVLVALCLAALPAVAADRVIQRGVDIWETVPETTFTSFANNPIPAGFFCAEFPGYTGQMWFKGVPLASDDPSALGTTDTIIERLDNAIFNKNGVARTRVRVRALQLEGIETLKTVCGDYNVKVTLDGEQPITRMRIVREHAKGGRFFVPLALNIKFTFTRVDNPAEQLGFSLPVHFAANPHHHWTYRKLTPEAKRIGRVTVDTDGDGTPDAILPGTSNFRAGNGSKTFCLSTDGGVYGDEVKGGGHGVTEPGPVPSAEGAE